MPSSCSFRITRTAEDLAQTINALSQRLVRLEQRQEVLELQLNKAQQEPSEEELAMLDGVEQLLRDCQELLATSSPPENVDQSWSDEEETLAA
ncbi:chemotaxis protein [Prochlorococcus sp. MIT 1341]|uniref:chemotaxis protein n=1 Tax=Prochlorococcus sp. MIT 1341 TaxID=3096221 RepID=UPI002A7500CE|nr:chemotaxis protein [Prochlorococcus sp. MIT 1341]